MNIKTQLIVISAFHSDENDKSYLEGVEKSTQGKAKLTVPLDSTVNVGDVVTVDAEFKPNVYTSAGKDGKKINSMSLAFVSGKITKL